MGLFRYFFQKRDPELTIKRIMQEQRMRFNPLRGFDPESLVRAIDGFRIGNIGDISRIIDELETRDDMMTGVARKTRASVGRCPHQVVIAEGYDKDERAQKHQEILRRFWGGIEVTSAFLRNERGGMRLLKKQMMHSVSRVYSVHEIVWRPLPDGGISAKFIQIPNWFFENRTGELRYLRSVGAIHGVEMPAGEWLITVGDGIGIAASVLAMAKSLSRNDWLLFSERCGQPGLHVTTGAAEGSPAWDKLVASVRNFGREWSMVSDDQTTLTPIDLNTATHLPYPPLIELCDKGIAALYRGADLSTISGASADATGASVQGDETDILEQDACEMLSETLAAQVERFVIRYTTGDVTPLAHISITPSSRPNVDQDIKIDDHLVSKGVKLSRNDALARYGRSEADPANPADAALVPPAAPRLPDGSMTPAYADYRATPLQNDRTPLQNAGEETHALEGASVRKPKERDLEASAVAALSEARARDLAPVIDRLLDALAETDEAALHTRLEALLADLPRLAAAIDLDTETDLLERILSDAVGAGYADKQEETA